MYNKLKLFNNGYIVKSLFYAPHRMYPPKNERYRGVGYGTSWPLDYYDDKLSKIFEKESMSKWFGYHDIIEAVPERYYLEKYVSHCNTLGIQTQILMIESPKDISLAIDSLKVTEYLGFDCICGVHYSYLTMDIDYYDEECTYFGITANKLNVNGLCNSIDDIYRHIEIRNHLLELEEPLELDDGAFPARLSIVTLD